MIQALTPEPSKLAPPFVNPVAYQNGARLVNVQLFDYYSPNASTDSLLAQYEQAAALQGYTLDAAVVSGTANGDYTGFTSDPGMPATADNPGREASDIWEIKGAVRDAQGNEGILQDVLGTRLAGYEFPFAPGHTSYGDHNYKVVPPVVNGQYDMANAKPVQCPGYLVLVSVETGEPIAAGQNLSGGYIRGVWYKLPAQPVTPVAPTPGTPGVL